MAAPKQTFVYGVPCRSISCVKDMFDNKIILTGNPSANDELQEPPKLNEDIHNCDTNSEHLNQLINKAQLRPLTIILHDCMKVATHSIEVKQSSYVDNTRRTINLRNRPNTSEFTSGNDGGSSSNVSSVEDYCSGWELDHLNSNETTLGLFKKANFDQSSSGISTEKIVRNTLLSNEVNFKPVAMHNPVDPKDLIKPSCENPVLQSPETFISKKHLISEHSTSKNKNSHFFPYVYEKDSITGMYYITSKISSDNSVFSKLLDKNKSQENNLSNQKSINDECNDLPFEQIVCLVCQKTFQSSLSFDSHKLQSDVCGKLFTGGEKLNNHQNNQAKAKPYKCEDCDKWFGSIKTRKCHHQREHQKKAKNYKKYLCCLCGMSTPSIEHLRAHEKTHRLPEEGPVPMPFKCFNCNKRFISNFKLKKHLSLHRQNHRPFKCRQCNAKFTSSESLENHTKSHLMNEEFKCEICSKVFSKKSRLYKHKKSTHITFQFYCNICDKGFKMKHQIEQHMISHSEERPIICAECGETFKRKTHLKQHITAFH